MRERRWESRTRLEFDDVLALGRRLAALGLKPATPPKDIICYIEDWPVESPEDLVRMDPWVTEDVTFVHSHEGWQGDFFLLAGGYHTVYQRHLEVGTYCSISHPWKIPEPLSTHHPGNMFWLGFRHAHAFIRVRLHTTDVITPGETRGDDRRAYTYRCSAHCPLGDVPDILRAITPGGRLYATLCEFRSQQFLPNGEDAYAIVGVMGLEGGFKIEVRLNRAPLPEDAVDGWLEALVGMPLAYAPLSPFP